MPVLDLPSAGTLGAAARTELGLPPPPQPSGADTGVLLAGGGLANQMMALWSDPAQDRGSVLRDLARAARDLARDRGRRLHVPYAPEPDLPHLLEVVPRAESVPAGCWCYFDTAGAETLDDFVQQLARKPRQTWRADQRAAERLQLTTEVVEVTEAALRRAAPLVASVQSQGGFTMSPRLMEWRLGRYLPCRDRTVMTFLSQRGTDVAVSIVQHHPGFVADQYVGLLPGHPDRVNLYHLAAFLVPVAFALEVGRPLLVGLGPGHERPKLLRGASTVALHHVRERI